MSYEQRKENPNNGAIGSCKIKLFDEPLKNKMKVFYKNKENLEKGLEEKLKDVFFQLEDEKSKVEWLINPRDKNCFADVAGNEQELLTLYGILINWNGAQGEIVLRKKEVIKHPNHYNMFSFEVFEMTDYLDFNLGNAFKYIFRSPFKNAEIEDLKKAIVYIKQAHKSKSYRNNCLCECSIGIKTVEDEIKACTLMNDKLSNVINQLWTLCVNIYTYQDVTCCDRYINEAINALEKVITEK